MLTSKQRAYLRGLAAHEDTIVHIGKGGITENIIVQMREHRRERAQLLPAGRLCDLLFHILASHS
jgi:RNA-binding protein YhbY